MTSTIFRFTAYPSFEESLQEQDDQMKFIQKIFFKLHFLS